MDKNVVLHVRFLSDLVNIYRLPNFKSLSCQEPEIWQILLFQGGDSLAVRDYNLGALQRVYRCTLPKKLIHKNGSDRQTTQPFWLIQSLSGNIGIFETVTPLK